MQFLDKIGVQRFKEWVEALFATKQQVEDNAYVTSAALNDLNDRLETVEGRVNEESDPIFTASAAAEITSSDITNWNSKTSNIGTITGITMNGASKGTSGVVDLGTVVTSETDPTVPAWAKTASKPTYTAAEVGALPSTTVIPDVSTYFDDAEYDSENLRINFKHNGVIKKYIDATDFIKDGMVNTVAITNGNLVVTFNTDAGKQPISIPLTDIFNPNNYYTKTESDGKYVAIDSWKLGSVNGLVLKDSPYTTFALPGTQLEQECDYLLATTQDIPNSLSDLSDDSTHRLVTDTEKTTWNNKVSDVQADWNAASGLAQILNKPTIPAAVTESTVSGWGFTKNTGTLTGVSFNGTNATINNGVAAITATIPTVNNNTITIQKGGTTVDSFTTNGSAKTINIPNELPAYSASNNGQILGVVNGALTWITPTQIYSGSSAPNNSTGNNGDVYLQT